MAFHVSGESSRTSTLREQTNARHSRREGLCRGETEEKISGARSCRNAALHMRQQQANRVANVAGVPINAAPEGNVEAKASLGLDLWELEI